MSGINYLWTSACPVVLMLVLFCRECQSATLGNIKADHQQTETIVAVAGVSPALLDTALSLFDPNGKNGNWQFTSGVLGGKDKFLPFPMMEAPKPLMPMRPLGFGAMQRPPQPPTGEKDQAPNGLAPLQPLKPLQAPETVVEDASSEHEQSVPVVEHEQQLSSEAAPPSSVFDDLVDKDEQPPHHMEQPEPELIGTGWSPEPPAQKPTGNNGWNQHAQGGHSTGGNQLLSMNLNANHADFTHSSNVNMNVVSDGGSTSNVHYFGSRVDANLKPHHHGHTHNGLTSYKIQFKKES